MRWPLAPAAAVMLAALPVQAQPAPDGAAPPPGTAQDGAALVERGLALMLRGLLTEMAPEFDAARRDMAAFMAHAGPALADLAAQIDDIRHYERPRRLENGDIVIRRKEGAPPPPPLGEGPAPAPAPEGEISL